MMLIIKGFTGPAGAVPTGGAVAARLRNIKTEIRKKLLYISFEKKFRKFASLTFYRDTPRL